jgi:hypothetical protein
MCVGDRCGKCRRADWPNIGDRQKTTRNIVATLLDKQIAIDLTWPNVNVERMLRQRTNDLGCFHRYIWCFTIDDSSRHQHRPLEPLGDVDAKLGEQAADHVDCLCTLLTSKSRVRCIDSGACCSGDFTGTNRIVGRVTASQTASATASISLAPLDIRHDVSRRHQTQLMAA